MIQVVLLILDLDEEMGTVNLDPKGLLEVLTNLTANALDACTLGEGIIQKPEITIRSNRLPGKKILFSRSQNTFSNC